MSQALIASEGRDPPEILDARDPDASMRDRLLKALGDADAWMTIAGLAGQVGVTPNAIEADLNALVDDEQVRRLPQGARSLFKLAQSSTPEPLDKSEARPVGNSVPTKRAGQTGFSHFKFARPDAPSSKENAMPEKKSASKPHGSTLLEIIGALKGGPLTIAEIAKAIGCEQHVPPYHLRRLAKAGKVEQINNRLGPWRLIGDGESAPKAAPTVKSSKAKKVAHAKPAAEPKAAPAAEPAPDGCRFALWSDGRFCIERDGQGIDLEPRDVARLHEFLERVGSVTQG